MKNNKIKDERVIEINNRIQSEAFRIIFFLLASSLFVKSYIMNLPVSSVMSEICIMISSIIFISIRSMFLGHKFIDYSNKRKSILIIIAGTSVIVSVVNGIKNYTVYNDKYSGVFDMHFIAVILITFISSVIFISLILLILSVIDKEGENRIERILKKDQED